MNRRDIELLISAKDTTGRTFQNVAANVAALADTIERQAEAAARGELSLDKLQATQKKLGEVGQELAAIQGLIDSYGKLNATLAKDETQLAELQAKHAALTAEIATAGKATAAQERTLGSLEKRINSLNTSTARNRQTLAEYGQSLNAVGVDARNLDAAQAQIVAAATRTGQAMVTARNGISGFDAELFKAAEAAKKAGQAIDLSFANKGLQFQENTRLLNAMVAELERAEKKSQESAQALANFQQIGRDALAGSAGGLDRFIPNGAQSRVQFNAVAAGLASIVEPGRAALQTLTGVETAIAAASTVAGNNRARINEYSDAVNQLSAASAALVRQGALVDSFKEQQAVVAQAQQKFDAAEAELRQFAEAVRSATVPNAELAAKLRQAEAAAAAAGRELLNEDTRLGQLSRGLRQAGIDANNLDAAQHRLEAGARQVAAAQTQLNSTLGRNGQRAGGLFGLDPYALQNLSFQVNDVVTSLASGQRPLQVLFQQGGQITQLFPGLISQIARFALAWSWVIGPLVAVGALIAGLAAREQEVRRFTNALRANVDGSFYDPRQLEMTSRAIQELGVSSADAEKAILSFVNAGLAPDKINSYAIAAANMAQVLGVEVPEAANKLLEGTTKGLEGVVALDKETNTLTASELEHVRVLFESGKAAEARQFVFDRVSQRMNEVAALSRGPWSQAALALRTAWNSTLDAFAKTGVFQNLKSQFEGIRAKFQDAAADLVVLSGLLEGKSFRDALAESNQYRASANAQRAQAAAQAAQRQERQRQIKTDAEYLAQLRETTTDTSKLTKAERVALAQRKAMRTAAQAGLSDRAVAEAGRIAGAAEAVKADDAQEKKDKSAASKANAARRKAEAAARKAQNEAEAAQRKIDSAQQELTNQLRSLAGKTGRGDSATLEERLAAVDAGYGKIYDSIKKLRDLGINKSADGTDLATVEAQAKAQQARAEQEEKLKYYEEQVNALTKERKDQTDAITAAQVDGAKSVVDAYNEAKAVNAEISPQIVEAARNALQIAQAIAGVKPNPEMRELIARLQRIIGQETNAKVTTTVQADVGQKGLADQEKDLNKTLSERNELVESYATLVRLGLLSQEEATRKTQAAYDTTRPAILAQVEAIRQTIELLHQQGVITDTVYNTWLAKLQAIQAGTKLVNADALAVNQAIVQGVANAITSAFDLAVDSIGGLIDGTRSLGDTLQNIFTSALSIIGDFSKAIAQAIIQVIALNTAKKLVGSFSLFHGGGMVGSSGGRMVRSGVNPMAFLAAPRLHSGGGLGLKNDEYAAILQRGERVLTEQQQASAARAAGQGSSGGQDPRVDLKVVNQLDSGDIVEAGLQTRSGQKVLVNTIRANRSAIKEALGG